MTSVDEQTFTERRPWAVFVMILSIGVALLAIALAVSTNAEHPNVSRWLIVAVIGEHLASAAIVAGIMGLTYEWFVHRKAVSAFGRLFDEQRGAIDNLLREQQDRFEEIRESIQATHVDDVFGLLYDIAVNRDMIPTLYSPPRSKDEFVFTTNRDFFHRLTAPPGERERAVKTLRTWISRGSKLNARFLGSDLIGELELRELADELQRDFFENWRMWREIKDDGEKACTLNYAWAASRCEAHRYNLLTHILLKADEEVQEWILHVPMQMNDVELREMIDAYLATRGASLSRNLLERAGAAIGRLHVSDVDMTSVATRHRQIFEAAKLWDNLQQAMSGALPIRTNFFKRLWE